MNKTLIALAVSAASITSVNAAEVYSDATSSLAVGGRFEARAVMADNDAGDTKVNDATRVRVNVAGKTDITDTVYALGFWEGEYTDGNAVNNRHLNAGIGGDFGQVRYGKTDGSLGMITDFTDIMSYHGNEAGGKIAAADRTGNNLAYVGSFDIMGDNLTVKANYVFDNGSEEDGYSFGAIYALDMGLAFGAGYGEQELGTNTNRTAKQAFGAISYTHGDFYIAGLYQDARNASDNVFGNLASETRGYEFAAAYTLNNTVFTATYNYLEDRNASGKAADLTDSIALDATHYFNKNFRTYASYKFNNLDQAGDRTRAGTSDEFVLGARYDF
ncbi:porin [Photobacterium gaetbulicola]|uniref:OmpL_phopr porin-like protein L n=1 Tax=Photobacterium gaetbulicola Gung47 TaxID=658445 RepID=A0A0C5WXX0_9GAMM|nr:MULTISPECIES: porin [Photobacterium]AJR09834.1 ompL_phopr porin-like protein L precursor [Photobacterium gaetbulicola Gung47]PSU12357.1 porin [Photobacterium gaetbulicola]WEM41857.1 porin [Photobacterium sp. DA100]